MELSPLKKIGEPVSFKGLKGVYLYQYLAIIFAGLISVVIVIISTSSNIIAAIGILIIGTILGILFNIYKEKSKGDMNISIKKKTQKIRFQFKGVIVKKI